MEKAQQDINNTQVPVGSVYVMTHSFFSDVVRIGCTPEDPQKYTEALSAKTPGQYTLIFSLKCSNPCKVKKQIREHLNAQEYVNEFYQVSAEVAESLLKREALRIPSLMA